MLRAWCLIRGLRSRLWLGIEGWVNRWWVGGSHSSATETKPSSRAVLIHASLEAENTAPSRRVRELEKENEFLGKASAFFASGRYNTSDLS